MRISFISTLFFNNDTYYSIYKHTQRALFLSLDDDENNNKRRSVLFLHSLLFLLEVYVFGAENDVSRSGDRVRTKQRFFSSLFVLRSETLTDAVFVGCCFAVLLNNNNNT